MLQLMERDCSYGRDRGRLRWTASVVCVLVALSFIAFEVLDLDGSNVAATDREGDLRRAAFEPSVPAALGLDLPDRGLEDVPLSRLVESSDIAAAPSPHRSFRSALARSLLADPAPSL